jgi:hypothetical protein
MAADWPMVLGGVDGADRGQILPGMSAAKNFTLSHFETITAACSARLVP